MKTAKNISHDMDQFASWLKDKFTKLHLAYVYVKCWQRHVNSTRPSKGHQSCLLPPSSCVRLHTKSSKFVSQFVILFFITIKTIYIPLVVVWKTEGHVGSVKKLTKEWKHQCFPINKIPDPINKIPDHPMQNDYMILTKKFFYNAESISQNMDNLVYDVEVKAESQGGWS